MYPEAISFAQEALATTLPIAPSQPTSAKLSSLSQSIVKQSAELINLHQGKMSEVEHRYCELSVSVSEFRHLTSLAAADEKPQYRMEKKCETVQQLPNELVLCCLQFVGRTYSVFPQLSRSSQRLMESSPGSLGVLRLNAYKSSKLLRRPKPRCLSSIHYSGDFVLTTHRHSTHFDLSFSV